MGHIQKFLPGTTKEVRHTSSGNTADSSSWSVFNGDEVAVFSGGSLSNSGDGHYYGAFTTPSTPGFYVIDSVLVFNGRPYRERLRFQVGLLEVD